MSTFLSHPLTVAVIGAGIIGVLVQQLTRWWQDQRKAWEIRVMLVTGCTRINCN
jgi:type III secretory pathway component EscS